MFSDCIYLKETSGACLEIDLEIVYDKKKKDGNVVPQTTYSHVGHIKKKKYGRKRKIEQRKTRDTMPRKEKEKHKAKEKGA